MKKKILSGVFALALLVTAGYGVNKSMKSDARLSDLALANVEALAQENGEGEGEGEGDCEGRFYKSYNFSGSSVGLVSTHGSSSCSSPCPNVTTNGVYGSTYKCMK